MTVRRVRLFEWEDQAWYPASLRNATTDLLRLIWQTGAYKPVVARLKEVLGKTGETEILDLASGGGGPVLTLHRALRREGWHVQFTLCDMHPNMPAFQHLHWLSGEAIRYLAEPVDASDVPPHLDGLRTMFASLHHLPPEAVSSVLRDAVEKRRAIAIFDFARGTPPPPSAVLLGNPAGFLLLSPFLRPFRWSRLFWTYVIPVAPLTFLWDAFVSGLRLYSVEELWGIVSKIPHDGYTWEIGSEPFPSSITYVIGYPLKG